MSAVDTYTSNDCHLLYEELKNTIVEHLQQNSDRFYINTTKENFDFQNTRITYPPIINRVYKRTFVVTFNDLVQSRRREIKILNQRANTQDTLMVVEEELGRRFNIADSMIQHNITHYVKSFVDGRNQAEIQEEAFRDHQQWQHELAAHMQGLSFARQP
jgi:hypothetical protein